MGYVGIMYGGADYPCGPCDEIGWRLHRNGWGKCYATEAAKAVLKDARVRLALPEVLAFTSPDNFRSQAVMARLSLMRRSELDFSTAWVAAGKCHDWMQKAHFSGQYVAFFLHVSHLALQSGFHRLGLGYSLQYITRNLTLLWLGPE